MYGNVATQRGLYLPPLPVAQGESIGSSRTLGYFCRCCRTVLVCSHGYHRVCSSNINVVGVESARNITRPLTTIMQRAIASPLRRRFRDVTRMKCPTGRKKRSDHFRGQASDGAYTGQAVYKSAVFTQPRLSSLGPSLVCKLWGGFQTLPDNVTCSLCTVMIFLPSRSLSIYGGEHDYPLKSRCNESCMFAKLFSSRPFVMPAMSTLSGCTVCGVCLWCFEVLHTFSPLKRRRQKRRDGLVPVEEEC